MGKAEASVEKYLRARIIEHGGMCLKFSASITNGVPDRAATLPGVGTFFVETKARDGVLSPLQRVRHAEMREAGATVYVADTREAVDELVASLVRPTEPHQEQP